MDATTSPTTAATTSSNAGCNHQLCRALYDYDGTGIIVSVSLDDIYTNSLQGIADAVQDSLEDAPVDTDIVVSVSGYKILADSLRSTQDKYWKREKGRSYKCPYFTFDYDKETTEKWDTATDAEKEEWLRCAKEEVDIALRFESGDWQYVTVTVTLGTVTDSLGGIASDDKDWHEGGSGLKSMCENVLEQFIEKHS